MKDLNELMQAILDMDTAQRKATAEAKEERAAKLAELESQKKEIADEFAAKAQQAGQEAARRAQADNAAALAELKNRQQAATQNLDAHVAAHRQQWVEELCRRALDQADASEVS